MSDEATPTEAPTEAGADDRPDPPAGKVEDDGGSAPPEPEPKDDVPDNLAESGRKAISEERRRRKEAEARVRELEQRDLRRSVAEDLNLTSDQVALLVGETEEELMAHYEELSKAFRLKGGSRYPREALRPGAVPSSRAEDMGSVADRVLG